LFAIFWNILLIFFGNSRGPPVHRRPPILGGPGEIGHWGGGLEIADAARRRSWLAIIDDGDALRLDPRA
jgi:hypothetical protein